MVIFLLRDKAMIDLAGKQSCICHRIEHQTERAVLLSVILVDGEKLRCQAVNEAEDANIIQIPAWIWQKKEPAKPMGAPR